MNNTLVKSILAGLLIGGALFIMPFFLLRFVVFFLIIGALFRLFGGGRFRRRGWGPGWGYGRDYAFTDRIRQMSDDEYSQYKQRSDYNRYGNYVAPKTTNENPTNS
ncbi:hypothetical protein [Spirosoma validum]|uniref:Uncharacterized protein n=1 Tax=Spirosoma validum TaxID=2771355 RepID=A0A927GFR3_9BACT|nr:hypothetical protein [Spirosoma validum]MBD2756071.1 hypothetical protein [Spirosoma validum]